MPAPHDRTIPQGVSAGDRIPRKSILHVTECYSTGVAKAIDTIVRLSPDHSHHLLWSGEDEPHDRFDTAIRLPRGLLARIRAVERARQQTGAHVVHAHSSWAGVYARTVRPSTPVIYQPHGYKLCDPSLGWSRRHAFTLAERALGRHTDQVIVLSPEEEQIAAIVSSSAHRTFLPNVPALAEATPRRELATGRGRVVVMAGRLSEQKDPGFFAATAREVRLRDPSVSFRWLGDATGSAHVQQLREAGVDITGWLSPSQLADVLASAGVYLHTALYEGFPISLLDALWCGVPAIIRPIPALSGVNLPTATTPVHAADLIVALLDDGAQRAAARRAGEEVLEEMSTDRQREAIRLIYR